MSIRYKGLFDQQGFTLLEMVLVLMIMGMVASLSVVFIDNEDNQLRYEETIQKLETMHKATVADYKDGALYSGFVVDNGTLPTIAKEFVSIPENWIHYGETYTDTTDPLNPEVKSRVLPYLRLTKKDLVTTLDNNEYIIFNSDSKRFYSHKGYRAGYISLGIDSDRDYKDGWGRAFTVGLDIDDSVPDPETNTASFQDFELAINDPNIDSDMQVNSNVTKDNWSVALTDIVIKVQNDNTSDPVENIIIGLSVFTNKAFTRPTPATGDDDEICKDCWTTYHIRRKCISNQKQPVPTIGASESVSISDDEGYIWQTEALEKVENEETDCTPGHVINSDNRTANDVRIPAGEHIVFVGVDGGIDGNTFDGKIERKDLNSDGAYDGPNEFDELRDQAILKVIPRFFPQIMDPLVIE